MDKRRLGIIITITAGIFWGFSGACGQFLFQNRGVVSNWLVPLRLTTAGTIILISLLLTSPGKILKPWKDGKDAVSLILFSAFGMALSQYGYFAAIQNSNAGVATVLQYTGPLLILAFVCFRESRLPRLTEGTAFVLAFTGILILSTHLDFSSLIISNAALFWGAMSSIALAIYTLQPKKLIKKYGPFVIIGWGMLIGGILVSIITKPWNITGIETDYATVLAVMAIVILGTAMAFILYLSGVQLIGSSDAAMASCVEPVSAVIFSTFWLGVKFVTMDIFGMILIVTAVLIVSCFKPPEKDVSVKACDATAQIR